MVLPSLDVRFLETVLRVTVLLVGVLVVAALARRSGGSVRHALWTATALALVALPLLSVVLPRTEVPWPSRSLRPTPATTQPGAMQPVLPAGPGTVADGGVARLLERAVPAVAPERLPPSPSGLPPLAMTWLVGALLATLALAVGMHRARGLISRAVPVADPRWLTRHAAAQRAAGVARPVELRISEDIEVPMTGGVRRPVILLPASSHGWDAECLDVVLLHEMVHVRRADVLRQLLSRVAVALYWFHPLAWRAARQAMLAREQACDEAVVAAGVRPSRYAHHLVALADREVTPWRVPAMVGLDHAHLEERVMSILHTVPHRGGRVLTLAVGTAVLLIGAAAASLGPAEVRAQETELPAASTPDLPDPVTASAGLGSISVGAVEKPLPVVERSLADAVGPLNSLVSAPSLAPTAEPCEVRGLRRGVSISNERDGRTSRMLTEVVDGIRICGAVNAPRGGLPDGRFIPSGRLPEGVRVILAAVGPDVEQRMVITRGTSGNDHAWFVGGERRTFDADAAAWRDAMITVLESRLEVARVHGRVAAMQGEIASAQGRVAEAQGEVAMAQGVRAAQVGEVARVRARVAELDAMRAHQEVVQAQAAARRRVAEVAEVIESRERSVDRVRAVEAREQMAQVARESRIRRADAEAEVAERRAAVVRADAEVARVSERAAVRVVEARERSDRVRERIEALDADRRTAEIEQQSSPAVERFLRLARNIGS